MADDPTSAHPRHKSKGDANAPKADNKADNRAETKDANVSTTGHSDPTMLESVGGFYAANLVAIPITILVVWIAAGVGWNKLRKWGMERGKAIRPLNPIIRDIIRFAVKEDTRVIHPKAPWLTARRLYALLFVLAVLGWWTGLPGIPAPVPTLVFIAVLAIRTAKVFKIRRGVVTQMFAVAHGECRYPKGSELNPWGFVNVTKWSNLVQPGLTFVTIPAAYQSEDMKTREKFERNFNGTVSEENAWTYKWESAKNRVSCQPAEFLPTFAPYPGPGPKWDEIPIGIKGDGSLAIMPLSTTPHALVCGPTGSGKSVLQQAILNHVLSHEDTWRIVAIDMKRVEMAFLRKYPNVLRVATSLEEATDVLRSLREEMMRRYEAMEEANVNHAKDLPDPPKAIMCMIDESTVLLAAEGIKSDEGKERDALHAECQMIIGELGRLSRASMIHVVMCFQRPDAKFLGGEIKANFDCRIAAGRMDTTPSLMVLDSEAANRLPKIKGRGMLRVGGELETFHGFFSEKDWYDKYLAEREAASAPDSADVPVSFDKPAAAETAKAGRIGGLAAKMAAKAEARAARMDAQAGAEGHEIDEVHNEPVGPQDERPSLVKRVKVSKADKRAQRAAQGGAEVLTNGLPPLPDLDDSPVAEVGYDDIVGAPPRFDESGNIDYETPAPPMPPTTTTPVAPLLPVPPAGPAPVAPPAPQVTARAMPIAPVPATADFNWDPAQVPLPPPMTPPRIPTQAPPAATPAPTRAPDPQQTRPVAPSAPEPGRPVLPQPVQTPVSKFRPGDPLPDWMDTAASAPAHPPVAPTAQQPVEVAEYPEAMDEGHFNDVPLTWG